MSTKVFKRSNIYTEENLLRLAAKHYFSANQVLTNPLCFFSAGFLTHLSLELILKACCLHYNNEFFAVHTLSKLLKAIPLKLDRMDMAFVKKIDMLHYLRYHFDETGSYDLKEKFDNITSNIFILMPKDFRDTWANVSQEILGAHNKMSKPVFKNIDFQHSSRSSNFINAFINQ
jgi:HEPN domain-containing protein